jgi:hypothetical protein
VRSISTKRGIRTKSGISVGIVRVVVGLSGDIYLLGLFDFLVFFAVFVNVVRRPKFVIFVFFVIVVIIKAVISVVGWGVLGVKGYVVLLQNFVFL